MLWRRSSTGLVRLIGGRRTLDYIPPAEAEANYYRQLASQVATVTV